MARASFFNPIKETKKGCKIVLKPSDDENDCASMFEQLPLNLGYAITTVHRSQCMTYNKLVIDLTGQNWKPGMFYTVLSRTRKLTDIIILAYDHKSFKVIIPIDY